MIKRLKRGFTLIELLIVIAIIGILAAIVLVGIDPVDKINAANDTKVQRDINALANATEAYAVANNSCYMVYSGGSCSTTPLDQAALVNSGDLKVQLTGTYTYSGTATSGEWYATLKSKKYTNATPATPQWAWCSSSSKAGAVGVGTPAPCPS